MATDLGVARADYDAGGFPLQAAFTWAVPAGAYSCLIKPVPGRVINAVVTAAGTGGDNLVIYDNTADPGNVLAVIPGSSAGGTLIPVNAPANVGIYAVNAAGDPGATIGYS
jgi:hypothetical protein